MRYTSTLRPWEGLGGHLSLPTSRLIRHNHAGMLELEHIYKSFEGRTVLSDVSLTIPQGATHALIGSSGSGKTTLLRLTLGLIPFDTGYVKINNQALLSFTPTEWADRIGYVPQEGGLFPHISGRQNVALVADRKSVV